MPRWGMVIDLTRCSGCTGCHAACKAENATPPGVTWARLEYLELGTFPNVRRLPLPLLCMHCAEPECERVCPTGATYQRDDGIVKVNATEPRIYYLAPSRGAVAHLNEATATVAAGS